MVPVPRCQRSGGTVHSEVAQGGGGEEPPGPRDVSKGPQVATKGNGARGGRGRGAAGLTSLATGQDEEVKVQLELLLHHVIAYSHLFY